MSWKIKGIDQLREMELYLLFKIFNSCLQFLRDRVDCCKWIAACSLLSCFYYHNMYGIKSPSFCVRYV